VRIQDFKLEGGALKKIADPGGAHPTRAPPKIGKNMILWRKIVISHTKYPKNFRAFLHSAQFF
jgi:hypothetical protein